jgi:uncharacterized protein
MELLIITAITILSSAIGTLTGFGTSTIMVPVLLFLFPLPQTLLLVGVIHWFGDIWKILLFRKGFNWRIILSFGITGIAASYLGANVVFSVSEIILSRILGVFLLIYVLFILIKPGFKVASNIPTAMGGGALSGFFAGVFGVGGPIRGLFLSAFNLPKSVYISTAGAIALFIDTTRISAYLLKGVTLDRYLLWGFFLFIPASFLGAGVAKKIVDLIPQKKFRSIIAAFLLLAGLKFIFFPHI